MKLNIAEWTGTKSYKLVFVSLSPDNLRAVKDVWILGDQFLREIYSALPAMHRESTITRHDMVNCCNFYNVDGLFYYNTQSVTSSFTRIVNSLIITLNKLNTLPRMVMIVPDKDLINHINFSSSGTTQIVGIVMDWLIRQIERIIYQRKAEMHDKKMGSVVTGEPKIIWVKALEECHSSVVVENVQKFNKVLESMLSTRRDTYFLDPSQHVDNTMFMKSSDSLVSSGKIHYWKSVDEQIKKFDHQEITLKPRMWPEYSGSTKCGAKLRH